MDTQDAAVVPEARMQVTVMPVPAAKLFTKFPPEELIVTTPEPEFFTWNCFPC